MASLIHLDTHVVVWLWIKDPARLRPMRRVLESHALAISPAVELEMQLLFEIGRLRDPVGSILAGLRDSIGLGRASAAFGDIVEHARGLSWTRDPIDRLVVGTALAEGVELLTADETILASFPKARSR